MRLSLSTAALSSLDLLANNSLPVESRRQDRLFTLLTGLGVLLTDFLSHAFRPARAVCAGCALTLVVPAPPAVLLESFQDHLTLRRSTHQWLVQVPLFSVLCCRCCRFCLSSAVKL